MDPFGAFYEHTVTIYPPANPTRDGGGGTQLAWSSTARQSNVPCLLRVGPASESERFSQSQLIGPVTGATAYTGLTRGDKVVVVTGPTLVGAILHVTAIMSQPGVDFLGIDTRVEFACEHTL